MTSPDRRSEQKTGWFYDGRVGAWRPCVVVGHDDPHLLVRLRDGSQHTTGLLNFLWNKPSDPRMPIRED